jgi:hypothetical protein
MARLTLSPDCRQGKHGSCTGDGGWDDDRDCLVECQCPCHHGTGLRILSDDDVALVTYGEASAQLGVPEATVRDWRRRELIFPAEFMAGSRPLFSLAEVWNVERVTRNGQGARRRA